MLVSFNPGFATNNSLAFGQKSQKRSGSYIQSTLKGALGGAVLGTAVGVSLNGMAKINTQEKHKLIVKAQALAENISSSRPLKLFVASGAAVGAVILVFNRMISKAKIQI